MSANYFGEPDSIVQVGGQCPQEKPKPVDVFECVGRSCGECTAVNPVHPVPTAECAETVCMIYCEFGTLLSTHGRVAH